MLRSSSDSEEAEYHAARNKHFYTDPQNSFCFKKPVHKSGVRAGLPCFAPGRKRPDPAGGIPDAKPRMQAQYERGCSGRNRERLQLTPGKRFPGAPQASHRQISRAFGPLCDPAIAVSLSRLCRAGGVQVFPAKAVRPGV